MTHCSACSPGICEAAGSWWEGGQLRNDCGRRVAEDSAHVASVWVRKGQGDRGGALLSRSHSRMGELRTRRLSACTGGKAGEGKSSYLGGRTREIS